MATQSTLADFEMLGRLGRGSFGGVFKCVRKADNLTYAMKQIQLSDLDESGQRDAVRECHTMASIDSPFVIRYYDSFLTEDGTLCIVMEYADRGDLQRMVRKQAGSPLPEERIWSIIIQIMIGLCHLHDQRILHRDLKTANVLLQSGDKVKIGDLGVARVLGTDSFFARTVAGSE
jgi:NIMA (never in mitosis gene a)-related kinase 1/4/5